MRQLRFTTLRKLMGRFHERLEGYRRAYAVASAADGNVEFALQALLARFPGLGTPTALPYIGRDRLIRRGFAESDDSYALRLIGWRTDHRQAGGPFATMRQLAGYVSPHPTLLRIVNSHGTWYTLNPDGTRERYIPGTFNWNWDGLHSTLFARFWLLIYPDTALWQRDGTWVNSDGSTWGDDAAATWGSTATRDQVRDVRTIVNDWRSAGGLLKHVVVVFGADFDPANAAPPLPDGNWARHSKLDADSNCVRARSDDAIYWRGTP